MTAITPLTTGYHEITPLTTKSERCYNQPPPVKCRFNCFENYEIMHYNARNFSTSTHILESFELLSKIGQVSNFSQNM